MPQQPDPAQDYRYNGKERLPGSEIYAYGFRHYDPTVGRFLGVDPISDRFAWASVYNYAENEPVGHIDLHGLQKWNPNFIVDKALNDLNNLLGRPAERLNAFFSKTKMSSETERRVDLGIQGGKNLFTGVLATAGGAAYTKGTVGMGAAFGGGALMTFGIGEAGIGLAQIVDAMAGEADPGFALHRVETVPGLIAAATGSEYTGLIDKSAAVVPTLVTQGLGAASGVDDLRKAGLQISRGEVGTGTLSLFKSQDAASDFRGLLQEMTNTASSKFGNQNKGSASARQLFNQHCGGCLND